MSDQSRASWPSVRYRYRTAAVAGPWRETREAALRNAVKAGQADVDKAQLRGVRWKLPGTIETDRRDTEE